MKEKYRMTLLVVGILLVVAVGISFAYFTVGITLSGRGSSTSLSTAKDFIKVQYDAGDSKLLADALTPGHSTSKSFKISVTPTSTVKEVTYRIYLNVDSNTFEFCSDSNYNSVTNNCLRDAEELIYVLKDASGNEIARGNLTGGITGEIEIARETKYMTTATDYNYTVEIQYLDTNYEQNHNKNKKLTGSIKVEFAEDLDPDLNILAIYVKNGSGYDSVNEVPVGKTLNTSRSYCSVNGTKDSSIGINYDSVNGKVTISAIADKTKCTLYFDN